MKLLKGYVTYIAVLGMLLLAAVDAIQGDYDSATRKATEALGFFGLRRAVG